jgi:hypothetical protein
MVDQLKQTTAQRFLVSKIVGEGRFGADRFGVAVGHYLAIVETVGRLPQVPAEVAEVAHQQRFG